MNDWNEPTGAPVLTMEQRREIALAFISQMDATIDLSQYVAEPVRSYSNLTILPLD